MSSRTTLKLSRHKVAARQLCCCAIRIGHDGVAVAKRSVLSRLDRSDDRVFFDAGDGQGDLRATRAERVAIEAQLGGLARIRIVEKACASDCHSHSDGHRSQRSDYCTVLHISESRCLRV